MGCVNTKSAHNKNKREILSNSNTINNAVPKNKKLSLNTLHDRQIKLISKDEEKRLYSMNNLIQKSRIILNKNIEEDYKLEYVLGSGFSGEVRAAKNILSGKKVAIKTLSRLNINIKKASMIYNEVSIYLTLDHPNIAKLYQVYENESNIYLVMEYCKGKELYERLQYKKKYSESDASRIVLQMLNAINYCHKKNICHRDLKLENWVFADDEEDSPLKLIDFGFSRLFHPGVPMTAMHGTVYYVSPEVLDGCYDNACDIWSLGVIVYMLLSGTPPFAGSSDAEILQKIRLGQLNFPPNRWANVSDTAKDFISKLLNVNSLERITAEQAIQHPWIKQETHQEKEISIDVLEAIKNFSRINHIKRAALSLIAYQMPPSDVRDLEMEFRALDKDNNGLITLNMLSKVLMDKLDLSEAETSIVFQKLDTSGSSYVEYSDFLAATIAVRQAIDESRAKEVFAQLDINRTGKISLKQLRQYATEISNTTGRKNSDLSLFNETTDDTFLTFSQFFDAIKSETPASNNNQNTVMLLSNGKESDDCIREEL